MTQALQAATATVGADHTIVVVLDQLRPWWEPIVARLDPKHVVVEPFDRGTGVGVALAVARILREARSARLVVLEVRAGQDFEQQIRLRLEGTSSRRRIEPAPNVHLDDLGHLAAVFDTCFPEVAEPVSRNPDDQALYEEDKLLEVYSHVPYVDWQKDVLASATAASAP